MDIPDVYPRRLPERLIAERLRSLGLHAGTEIYTHSPFDGHPHHRSVAFATSLVFPELKVEALASRPSEVHVLTEADFARKLHIVNSAYALEIRPPDEAYVIPAEAVAAIESFTHVTAGEVVRALALTQPEIRSEYPDMWGFDTSPYELERMEKTVNVMLQAVAATG
jgi:LmbE family N-acetylglucosaminyl deacetylase